MIKNLLLVFFLLVFFRISFASFMPDAFEAKFIQESKSIIHNKVKTSEGLLKYKYSSHIFLDIKQPSEVLFVSNPKKSWKYSPPIIKGERGILEEMKTSSLPNLVFFDLLRNGLKDNKYYYVKKRKKDSNAVTLYIKKPYSKNFRMIQVDILFKSKSKKAHFRDVERLTATYSNNSKIDYVIKDLNEKPNFGEKQFVFQAPIGHKYDVYKN